MTDAADRHRRFAAVFSDRVRGVRDWDAAAPVDGWTARDVVGHLTTWLPGFLAGGAKVHLPSGPDVADDPVEAWRVHSEAVQALLEDPASSERTFANPHTGSLPLPDAVDRFYTSDVFLHTWDLARASGQDDMLDPDICTQMLAGMEPMADMLYASGQYGPRVDVPEGSDVQTRLLGLIGRDPAWRPPSTP